jgi:hypothetical protein
MKHSMLSSLHFDVAIDTSILQKYIAMKLMLEGFDLIYANNSSNSIGIRRNLRTSGSISFDGQTSFSTANNPTGVAIADFNGDSKPDMVATNAGSGTVSFYRNTATSGTITSGSFASAVTLGTGSAPYGLSQTLNNIEVRIDQGKALDLLTKGTDSEIQTSICSN